MQRISAAKFPARKSEGTMRMWSVAPRVLDTKGIVACWRESLLAQAVLAGRTKGYTHHPQLDRFRACADPLRAIASYLGPLADEANRRGYHFDRSKIIRQPDSRLHISVTDQQLIYEWQLLLTKLRHRDIRSYERMLSEPIDSHPLFTVIPGPIATWEKAHPEFPGLMNDQIVDTLDGPMRP